MQLIRVGNFEINPDQILFIDKIDTGCEVIFHNDLVLHIANDTEAYIDLQMFVTSARHYYGNGDAHEEKESAESNQTDEKSA